MMQSQGHQSIATLTVDTNERQSLADAATERSILVVTMDGSCQAFDFGARTSLTIGRAEPADILLSEPSLSRLHACFRREDRALRVVDLGSRNGTWVAGQRIQEAVLAIGSTAQLGRASVSLQLQAATSPRTKTSADVSSVCNVPEQMIRHSRAMLQLHELVQRTAQHRIGVLLFGETGTGKELIAAALHEQGPRRNRPFKVVNCAAIPETLVESVLFGHVKGAFTGATRDQAGAFAQAHGGTVFLDEVGELSRDAQAALLRVLDTHRLCPVGGSLDIEVDVRVIAATHRDLACMTRSGSFRLDLYHRLKGMVLHIPPLRERREEIAPLAKYFLRRAGSTLELSRDALACMYAYRWPGNVRELRNLIERAIVVSDGSEICLDDLPSELRDEATDEAQHSDARCAGARREPIALDEVSASNDALDLRASLEQHELALISEALQRSGGNRRTAARLLRLPLRTFERKLQAFGSRIRSAC
ncbi:MAG TPA: sigma 54-interacting transcriptional regulator [Polyangiales bacterium]|nr:sigma 54-interacting transcriptional regulator [Polyangiales bacterium]